MSQFSSYKILYASQTLVPIEWRSFHRDALEMAGLQQPPPSQPDHTSALQDFYRFLEGNCKQGTIGHTIEPTKENSYYIPDPDLQAYFSGDKNRRLRNILREISLVASSGPPRVSLNTIQRDYVKVFSILLCIRRGYYIAHFVRYEGLNDQRLPFDERPHHFPSAANSDSDFFSSFYEKQWRFCAPIVEYKRHNEWQARRILPFVKDKISGGGSATTYKIVLHPKYNFLSSRGNGQPVKPLLLFCLDA